MRLLKGFPSRYKDAPEATGDDWWTHYRLALATVDSGGIVVMYGTNGTGKTRMAYELAKKCVPKDTHYSIGGMGWNAGKKERPAIYTTAVNLFMEIKDTFRPDSEQSELSLVKKYTDAGLLVLDEIQEKGSTQFEDRKITQIVDSRYMHERPTILIANYSRNEFAESLSPAILDRIRENGCGLYFDWESYRNAKCYAK
jgi:DNA replication protein DnaC